MAGIGCITVLRAGNGCHNSAVLMSLCFDNGDILFIAASYTVVRLRAVLSAGDLCVNRPFGTVSVSESIGFLSFFKLTNRAFSDFGTVIFAIGRSHFIPITEAVPESRSYVADIRVSAMAGVCCIAAVIAVRQGHGRDVAVTRGLHFCNIGSGIALGAMT